MAYGDIIEINTKKYKNVTPNMTSDTTPPPYAASSNGVYLYPAGYGPAFQSFCDPPEGWANGWAWAPKGQQNAWFQIDLGTPTKIEALQFNSNGCSGITFCGSNDGTNFDQLYKIVTVSNEIRYFEFNMPQVYRYYRIYNNNHGWQSVSSVRFFVSVVDYYLIQDDNLIKTIKDATLKLVDGSASQEVFLATGFTQLNVLGNVVGDLGNSFEILSWNEDVPQNIKVNFIPEPQLIIPTGDLRTSDLVAIKTASITTTGTTGIAKVVLSFDKGTTWKTFKDGSWQDIALTTEAVGTDGILHNQLSAIPEAKWTELLGKTLRFAYYLEKTAISDDLAVDALSITADMKGSWCKAVHGTDYDYEYASSEILNVKLLKDGSYKINTLTGGGSGGTVLSETLQPYDWNGGAAPYQLVIRNSIIKANDIVELAAGNEITTDQLKQLQVANIIGGAQVDGSITLLAYGDKPAIAIPVQFVVRSWI